MTQLFKDDSSVAQDPVRSHPLFSGETTVGMISGENPKFHANMTGHDALGAALQQMGLKAESREGRYGAPEKSWMVYGPTREQMFQLGQHFGQESVVFSQGGNHELLYTNGPNAGRYHPALNHEWFQEPPEDYYTHMPELGGYLRLNFDWNKLHPTTLAQPEATQALGVRADHEQALARSEAQALGLRLAETMRGVLAKAGVEAPPHPLEKKEGKTRYHQTPHDVKIPYHGTPERAEWDKAYYQRLVEVFAGGNAKRLVAVTIPINEQTDGHFIGNFHVGRTADRRPMYRRMAQAGDPMPPGVFRRDGIGWHVIDGNNRMDALRHAGRAEFGGYELLDADDPRVSGSSEKKRRPAAKIQGEVRKSEPLPPPAPHPHAYDWHNEHTDHHLHVAAPGVVLRGGSLEGRQPDGTVPLAQSEQVGSDGRMSLAKTSSPNVHPHMDGSKPPEAITAPAATQHQNDQAAGVGVSTYAKFAAPYGSIDKSSPSSLFHFPYQGKLGEIRQLVADHGYNVYYAGGKHGKPDLANRNYNTKHLMIYDPSPGSGGDFGTEEYTDGWRQIHELSHALVYPELNQIYGEGRRIGKLGTHRTMREALRAVHWEWLTMQKQRELSKRIGVEIPDHVFNKELNTVMHDAVHRAVTGKFTEPSAEGFRPHEHHIPLETALGMVREAGHNLGLTGMHDLMKKSETSVSAQEIKARLAKALRERIDEYGKTMLALRQRELKKSDPGTYEPAPEMTPMDKCPLCEMPDVPGQCKCLQGPLAPMAKSDTGGLEPVKHKYAVGDKVVPHPDHADRFAHFTLRRPKAYGEVVAQRPRLGTPQRGGPKYDIKWHPGEGERPGTSMGASEEHLQPHTSMHKSEGAGKCPRCKGTGKVKGQKDPSQSWTCDRCDGDGEDLSYADRQKKRYPQGQRSVWTGRLDDGREPIGHTRKSEENHDKYNYYLVHKETGKIHGGYEFREDAHDAAKDHESPAKIKVSHRSKVDAAAKEAFHRENKTMSKLHKSEMCKKCNKEHELNKCGLNEIKPGPKLGKGELPTKPKEPIKTKEGSGGTLTRGPALKKSTPGAVPRPGGTGSPLKLPQAPKGSPSVGATPAAAPAKPAATPKPAGGAPAMGKNELAKTAMSGMRGLPQDMQAMASAQAAKDAASKPTAAAAPPAKLPSAADHAARAEQFAAFTPSAGYVGHQSMGGKVPPSGTGHLQPPPKPAPKQMSAGPVMNAARPQAERPGIFGRLARLGKSESDPMVELKKSLGACALCGKDEHPGSC